MPTYSCYGNILIGKLHFLQIGHPPPLSFTQHASAKKSRWQIVFLIPAICVFCALWAFGCIQLYKDWEIVQARICIYACACVCVRVIMCISYLWTHSYVWQCMYIVHFRIRMYQDEEISRCLYVYSFCMRACVRARVCMCVCACVFLCAHARALYTDAPQIGRHTSFLVVDFRPRYPSFVWLVPAVTS